MQQQQPMNPWALPLEAHQAALAKAQAAGDNQAVQEISSIVQVHPDRAPDAYRKAKDAGDIEAQREIRKLFAEQRPITSSDELVADPIFRQDARDLYDSEGGGDLDDESIARQALGRMRMFNNGNSVAMVGEIANSAKEGRAPKADQAWLGAFEQLDRLPTVSVDGALEVGKSILLDPITYLGGAGVGKAIAGRGGAKIAAEQIARKLTAGSMGKRLAPEFVEDASQALVKQGVESVSKREIARGVVPGAAIGGVYGAGYEGAVQTQEQAAGARDSFDIGPVIDSATGGALLGGGLAAAGGAIRHGGNAMKIGNARRAIDSYQAQGDIPTTAAMQHKAIHSLPVPQETKERAKELFDLGDINGLGQLWGDIISDKQIGKLVKTKDFNAGVVKAVNRDAMNRGDSFMGILKQAVKDGDLPEAQFAKLKSSFDNARAPNSAWSAHDIDSIATSNAYSPIVREAAKGLKNAAYRANETVPMRTIRGQMSGLEEMAYNPINKALMDAFVPGGSTAGGIGARVATTVGRAVPAIGDRIGLQGPKPVQLMASRAKANQYARRAGIESVFTKPDAAAGQHLRKIENALGRLERGVAKKKAAETPPVYRRGADAADGILNGLQTTSNYLGLTPGDLKKTIAEFQQANPGREDFNWYAKQLLETGGVKNRDAFLGVQDDLADHLIKTGRKTPEQMAKSRMKAEGARLEKDAVTAILAEKAIIKTKLALGHPLTSDQARTRVILQAFHLGKKVTRQAAGLPGLPPTYKTRLMDGIAAVIKAKSQPEKGGVVAKMVAEIGDHPVVADFLLRAVQPLAQFGPK